MGSELKIGICRHCDIGVDEEEYAALYRKWYHKEKSGTAGWYGEYILATQTSDIPTHIYNVILLDIKYLYLILFMVDIVLSPESIKLAAMILTKNSHSVFTAMKMLFVIYVNDLPLIYHQILVVILEDKIL